eukprot:scaffold285949_cov17-Tisochrysis_lutea.AAC.2
MMQKKHRLWVLLNQCVSSLAIVNAPGLALCMPTQPVQCNIYIGLPLATDGVDTHLSPVPQ